MSMNKTFMGTSPRTTHSKAQSSNMTIPKNTATPVTPAKPAPLTRPCASCGGRKK